MKRIVLVSIALLALATTVFAQPGVIMLWEDAGFSNCDATPAPGVMTVYITHEGHPGTTASQFAVSENSGVAVHLADVNKFALVIGNTQTSYAVSYGGCFSGQVYVADMLYSIVGVPAACTGITVVPANDAPSGDIEAVNCSVTKVYPNASFLAFNNDGSCTCGEIVPTEATSWGRVKALYQ